MRIERATAGHREAWALLRHALWPSASAAGHMHDIERTFLSDGGAAVAFVALEDGAMLGFAEASLRRDYVNGCKTSPVAFLEGIYVTPEARRHGVARALVGAVEAWGRDAGCSEFASDTSPDNTASQRLHQALGFAETQRVVFFRKLLQD